MEQEIIARFLVRGSAVHLSRVRRSFGGEQLKRPRQAVGRSGGFSREEVFDKDPFLFSGMCGRPSRNICPLRPSLSVYYEKREEDNGINDVVFRAYLYIILLRSCAFMCASMCVHVVV